MHQDDDHDREQAIAVGQLTVDLQSSWPSDALFAMITISSPAIRLRQANAQPCLRPPTKRRQRGRQDDVAVDVEPARAEHPPGPQQDRRDVVDAVIRPLAIDGAAPRTTTKRIAASVSLNSRIASGNQAIDGIVCRP